MKRKIHYAAIALSLFLFPSALFSQTAPNLGAATTFELFTSVGALTNVGQSQVTGDIGTNSAGSTNFGNINGQIHDQDDTSGFAALDLNLAYINLGGQVPEVPHTILLGGGEILTPAIYGVPAASTLSGVLTLDGLNQANPCFVFKLTGAFAADPNSRIVLINGAKACNVFWRIDGATALATSTTFKGTIICDGQITMATGVNLEGRALSVNGLISIDNTTASTPIGCGSPVLTGPGTPPLGATACFALFTSGGALSNTGTTSINGDIGTNDASAVTNFTTGGNVSGVIHQQDAVTIAASGDLTTLYNYLNGLTYDIQLMDPVNFGNSQVLTPHVYRMNSAATLTDTIFLDAQGNASAIFVIQINNGALNTLTNSKVILRGGTKSSNVFWKVDGAVTMASGTTFRGTIVAAGAFVMNIGDTLDGRALSTTGAITTNDVNDVTIPSTSPTISTSTANNLCQGDSVTLTASLSASYLWSTGETTQSITVDTSGTFTVVVPSACGAGNDSSMISVTVNPGGTTNLTMSICNGDSVLIGGIFQSLPGTYSDTLTNGSGCDSLIVTVLSVNQNITTNLSALMCNGDSMFLEGAFQTLAGTYSDTLTSAAGCDSIAVTILSVGNSFTSNIAVSICNGDSLFAEGAFQTTPGTYSDTLTNVTGCDSIINTTLSVGSFVSSNNPQSICAGSSYIFNGNVYTTPGNYNDTLQAAAGCDSIITTQLSVINTQTSNNPQTICAGSSYIFNGNSYSTPGNYNDTIQSIAGCDSIIITQLSVNNAQTSNNPQTICAGSSYTFNGNSYSTPGNYNDTLQSIAGCDSIIITQLSVNNAQTSNNPQTICAGSSYTFNGNIYSTPGNYNDTLQSFAGCDSIIITQLSVNNAQTSNNPQTICAGSSYTFNGNIYSTPGNYNDTLQSVAGCDSIIITQLSVNNAQTSNNPQSICSGGIYTINGNAYSTAGNYIDTLQTVAGCDSIVITQLTVDVFPVAAFTSTETAIATYSFVSTSTNATIYEWNFGDENVSSTANATHVYATAGIYNVTLIVSNTCGSDAATQQITVITEFEFFNGFSPNGDGHNDSWNIPVLNYYPDNTVTIVNRWGSEVWKGTGYNNTSSTWTGKNLNGDDLPDGTYYYIIAYNNTEKRGWVFIKR